MRDTSRSVEVGNVASGHNREEAIAVIQSGRLQPGDPATAMTPEDEFAYRHRLAYGAVKDLSRLERFMLSVHGRSYLDAPELSELFYKDTEARAREVGQVVLFANLHTELQLSSIVIGFLGDSEVYPLHVRLGAQSANFNNTLGLVGLTRVKLEQYQRIVLDKDGQFDPLYSILANTKRWHPFVVERTKVYGDLTTFMERKDMRVGEREIKDWAEAHPSWGQYVEGTLAAVQTGTTNPVVNFDIPKNNDYTAYVHDFERDDNL